jgi:hypothetical protein
MILLFKLIVLSTKSNRNTFVRQTITIVEDQLTNVNIFIIVKSVTIEGFYEYFLFVVP